MYSIGGGSISVTTSVTPLTSLAIRTISFSRSGSAKIPEILTRPPSLFTFSTTLRVFGDVISAACTRAVVVRS